MKKKIVIISRVIFPHQAPRAMRATELAKEFSNQGYNVTLYGILGKYSYKKFEEETGVNVKPIGKPLFARRNSDETYRYTLVDKALGRMFGKLIEFPDIELMFMVNKLLKKEENIDLLITVAIPYPIHWGAALFRSLYPAKGSTYTWVADCGDPYMGNPMTNKLFYFKFIEKWFCRKTDYLSVPIERALKAYYPEFHHKMRVIPQGFNFSTNNYECNYKGNEIPTFIYAGNFYKNYRDPRPVLDFLSTLKYDFNFIIYTKSIELIKDYKNVLRSNLTINQYIPRKELLKQMSKADFLINFENNSDIQSPSKLIDYGIVGRPILSINTNKSLDTNLINMFMSGDYTNASKVENIEKYHISTIVKQFKELIKLKP